MKTSTLCMGSLSLVLLAAGAAGLADASAGGRSEGWLGWSPLAAASDTVAAWITPGAPTEASQPLPVRRKAYTLQTPKPSWAAAMAIPAMTVQFPTPTVEPAVVIPDWDCKDWGMLNAETPGEKTPCQAPCMEIRIKRPAAPRGHSVSTRVSSPRQRA